MKRIIGFILTLLVFIYIMITHPFVYLYNKYSMEKLFKSIPPDKDVEDVFFERNKCPKKLVKLYDRIDNVQFSREITGYIFESCICMWLGN